jgi:hypothetical protein
MSEKENPSDYTKFVKFSGESSKWREWSRKVKTIAKKKKWWYVLETQQTLDPSKTEAAEVKKVDDNDTACYYFTMCCEDKASIYVESAGDSAFKMWEILNLRYDHVNADDLVVLIQDYTDCKPKKHSEDPVLWFVELDYIATKIVQAKGPAKADAEIIAHIMLNMEKKHYGIVTSSLRLNKRKTLTDVKEAYTNHWKAEYKTATDEKSGGEAQMVGGAGGKTPWKQFKGNCHECGKQGHRKNDCPTLKKGAGEGKKNGEDASKKEGLKNVKCFRCKEKGHIARNCPEKEKKEEDAESFFGHKVKSQRDRREVYSLRQCRRTRSTTTQALWAVGH